LSSNMCTFLLAAMGQSPLRVGYGLCARPARAGKTAGRPGARPADRATAAMGAAMAFC
jgi:hypothetical protein